MIDENPPESISQKTHQTTRTMDIQITSAALELIREKGGTVAIDFIPPIG